MLPNPIQQSWNWFARNNLNKFLSVGVEANTKRLAAIYVEKGGSSKYWHRRVNKPCYNIFTCEYFKVFPFHSSALLCVYLPHTEHLSIVHQSMWLWHDKILNSLNSADTFAQKLYVCIYQYFFFPFSYISFIFFRSCNMSYLWVKLLAVHFPTASFSSTGTFFI